MALIAEFWPAIAAVVAIIVAWATGRKGGAEKERQRADNQRSQARQKADQVKEKTDAKSDDDVARELADKWVRGNDGR